MMPLIDTINRWNLVLLQEKKSRRQSDWLPKKERAAFIPLDAKP